MSAVLPHNGKAAATWRSGGLDYDRISESVSDSIEYLLNRLDVQPGERVPDLATGTGWTARRLAQKGAKVVGMDIAEGMIEAARRLAGRSDLDVDFVVADAEETGLPDASCDVITSTCGAMFASRPEAVARELARLCRPAGRTGLTTWPPERTVARLFQMMRPYMPPPPSPAPPSPFEWGRPERVSEFLGGHFSLSFEAGTTVLRMPSGERSTGYGPTRMVHQITDRKDDLRRAFIAFHEPHRTEHGISMPRDCLVVVGARR